MIIKIKSKIVEKEAMLFDGTIESAKKLCRWANDLLLNDPNNQEDMWIEFDYNDKTNKVIAIWVNSLEGQEYISKGDYVIKGLKGEFYPCKPDIFEQTYEKI